MTEPMIEETEAEIEEFTDELSDEALDREQGGIRSGTVVCCVPRAVVAVPVTNR
jgi:hypothetical protein